MTTVAAIKEDLKKAGISFKSGMKKAELEALLKKVGSPKKSSSPKKESPKKKFEGKVIIFPNYGNTNAVIGIPFDRKYVVFKLGKWNPHLSVGKGWIVSDKNLEILKARLETENMTYTIAKKVGEDLWNMGPPTWVPDIPGGISSSGSPIPSPKKRSPSPQMVTYSITAEEFKKLLADKSLGNYCLRIDI